MSFKIGDEVICIAPEATKDAWVDPRTGRAKAGPCYKEVTNIIRLPDEEFLEFAEYGLGSGFHKRYFRKLSEIEDLRAYKFTTAILEDLSAPIKIGKGLPQREPLLTPEQMEAIINYILKN